MPNLQSLQTISNCCGGDTSTDAPLLDRDSMPGELVIRRESCRVGRLGDLAVLGQFLEKGSVSPTAFNAIYPQFAVGIHLQGVDPKGDRNQQMRDMRKTPLLTCFPAGRE